MAGIFGLSCNEEKKGNFLEDLFLGTFYQQHIDEEWAGLGVWNGENIKHEAKPGLLRPNFEEEQNKFQGTEGIGCCGPDKEPIKMEAKIGTFCLCFSGNILNFSELKEELKNLGVTFRGRDEEYSQIEIIGDLIARGEDFIDGIKLMTEKIEGSYTLLVLTENKIFAARSSDGHWPLVIGKKDGEIAVASSVAGFDNLGFKIIRGLKAGEIISLKNGRFKLEEFMRPSEKVQICSFLWVYSDFPSGIYKSKPIDYVRIQIGRALARRDIERRFIPDIVAPIPDSGKYYAIGYKQEFDRQRDAGIIDRAPLYDEFLMKYSYATRSYTKKKPEKRKTEADVKILRSRRNFRGLIVVLVDDSIVRGNQIKNKLLPKVKQLGVKEIHVRIANSALLSHCPWGKTTKKGECLAAKMPSKEKRIKFFGVTSLEHGTIDDLVKETGLSREQLCVDCSLPEK